MREYKTLLEIKQYETDYHIFDLEQCEKGLEIYSARGLILIGSDLFDTLYISSYLFANYYPFKSVNVVNLNIYLASWKDIIIEPKAKRPVIKTGKKKLSIRDEGE